MEKYETITAYDQRLRELATEVFTLGEPIVNERLVNKVHRSFPERFNGKIWALEEVKDSSKIKLIELITILQVFEMNSMTQKKDKGIPGEGMKLPLDRTNNHSSSAWYFDSGSSRHMIGSRKFISDYVEQNIGKVTYGGGSKGNIVGKGTLDVADLPKLCNVLHVEGLTTNLIIISQLCNDNLHL
ncbi:uncharacterized protein [Henckelia pumila]|uniref:uncharacterized protein n=1 Tax=Henckelia pumila TaxID=405737 RepID=UPI003C6DF697